MPLRRKAVDQHTNGRRDRQNRAVRIWQPLVVCVVAPLALAACGGSSKPVATSSTTGAASPAAPVVTIKVTSVSTAQVTHDTLPKGVSKGDRIEFKDRLLNAAAQFGKPNAVEIGKDSGSLAYTSDKTATLTGAATLPNGTIKFDGLVSVDKDGTLHVAVVGGTGKYDHVTGMLSVGRGEQSLNTYTLTLPGSGPIA